MASEKKLPEHVQIIQSLMLSPEKGRAVLTPTFLLTGLVSLLLGLSLTFKAGLQTELGEYPLSVGSWISAWISTAACVLLLAFFFVAKQAKKDGHSVLSPQLKHVLRSALPALILGFTVGSALACHNPEYLPIAAAIWIASYGVALHSIRLYATKSIRILSALMLALGLACFFASLSNLPTGDPDQFQVHPTQLANFMMCLAFGILHINVASGSIFFSKLNR